MRVSLRISPLLILASCLWAAAAPAAGPVEGIQVSLHPVADTLISHQSAWIEVRITNGTSKAVQVPWRSQKIVGEWRFEDGQGGEIVGWPGDEALEGAQWLTIGAGETLYEVLSPESCFGVFTSPGPIRASCRAAGATSEPVSLSRRAARKSDAPSALRSAGPLHGSGAREKIQVELWSLCAKDGAFIDCDEGLFTVAWDRMQVAPAEAMAVVDTLIARNPGSGWLRPALFELVSRLPEANARRYLTSILERHRGGVADAYASELLRREGHREFPKLRK